MAFALLAGPAQAAKRVALVIGNSGYAVNPLKNPGRDADSVAAAFKKLGFEVTVAHDLDTSHMRQAVSQFGSLAQGAEVAVVFYAGHGTEIGGRNFLIPVDAKLARAADVELEAVSLDSVLAQLDGVTRLRLVILDACRNNVFPLAGSKRSTPRGLARVEPEDNTLIAYAARDGTTADDGSSGNSPFTAALLRHIATPGLDVTFVFRRIRDDVMRATARQQQPHLYGTLGGSEIVLAGGSPGAAGPTVAMLDPAPPPAATPPPPPAASSSASDPPLLRCDELAAHPSDQAAKTRGPIFDRIDKPAAVAACRQALAAYPGAPRFEFQLARALDASGESLDEAQRLYRKAADSGYAIAIHNLASLYYEGRGVPKDEAKGIELFRTAFETHKFGVSAFALGQAYQHGSGVPQDYSEAMRFYRAAADLKDPDGLNAIGDLYYYGLGVPKDQAEAFRYFRQAAEQGSASGLQNLAYAYENGTGTTKNLAEAVKYFEKAGDAGNADSYASVGNFYRAGNGVRRDYGEALRFYRLSISLGSYAASNGLAHMYENGHGVAKDLAESVRLLRLGAEHDDPESLYGMARITSDGIGVGKDQAQAAGYYYRALKAQSSTAVDEMHNNSDAWSLAFRRELQTLMVADGKFDGPANGKVTSAFKAAVKAVGEGG